MLKTLRGIDADFFRLAEPGETARRARAALRFAAVAALAFVLSRARVAGGLAPAALALFAAALTSARYVLPVLAGCLLGAAADAGLALDLRLPAGCAAVLAGGLARHAATPWLNRVRMAFRRAPRDQARSPNDAVATAVLAGLAVLVPGLLLDPALTAQGTAQAFIAARTLGAAMLAATMAPFAASVLAIGPDRRRLVDEERSGVALLGMAFATGLYDLWPPAALGACAFAAAALAPEGAAVGAGLGAVLALASGDARCAAALGASGLAAQLCARRGGKGGFAFSAAAGMAAGTLLGLGLPAVVALGIGGLAPAAVSAAGIVPEGAARILAARPEAGADPERLAAILGARTADRLRAMAGAFGDLAEGYLTSASMPDEQALVGRLRSALCAGCPDYARCWAGEDNRAARLLCDLIGLAVNWADAEEGPPLFDAGVPSEFARRCRRSRVMPERLGNILEDFALARRGELKRGAENRLISAQFLQARQMLEALADEQSRPVRLRDRQARRAAAALDRAGIDIADALMLGGRRAELVLTLRDGQWTPALASRAAARLEAAFGRVYAPEGAWGATMRFTRMPRLCATAGAACVPREAGVPSGDSHMIAMLDDERLMAVICDGMGSGEAAARESACAARLLARFLAAGADWPLAVETANALVMNMSSEDMFSTVDLMILNLATGMAEFVKLAACPALVAREGGVERVEGGRLPLGILDRVQPSASRVQLMPGDVVLLASDGVMDAVPPGTLEALMLSAGEDMDALSERVIAAGVNGAHRDDMTAVCVRLDVRGAA